MDHRSLEINHRVYLENSKIEKITYNPNIAEEGILQQDDWAAAWLCPRSYEAPATPADWEKLVRLDRLGNKYIPQAHWTEQEKFTLPNLSCSRWMICSGTRIVWRPAFKCWPTSKDSSWQNGRHYIPSNPVRQLKFLFQVGKDYLLCDYNRDGDSYRYVVHI